MLAVASVAPSPHAKQGSGGEAHVLAVASVAPSPHAPGVLGGVGAADISLIPPMSLIGEE